LLSIEPLPHDLKSGFSTAQTQENIQKFAIQRILSFHLFSQAFAKLTLPKAKILFST